MKEITTEVFPVFIKTLFHTFKNLQSKINLKSLALRLITKHYQKTKTNATTPALIIKTPGKQNLGEKKKRSRSLGIRRELTGKLGTQRAGEMKYNAEKKNKTFRQGALAPKEKDMCPHLS